MSGQCHREPQECSPQRVSSNQQSADLHLWETCLPQGERGGTLTHQFQLPWGMRLLQTVCVHLPERAPPGGDGTIAPCCPVRRTASPMSQCPVLKMKNWPREVK